MTRPFRDFFARQIREIAHDETLRFYGALLGLTHVFTFWFWRTQNQLTLLEDPTNPICWPFWPGCATVRVASPLFWSATSLFYLGLGLATIAFFALSKVRWGYAALLAATLLKAWVQIQDYRLMGNYHYMQFAVCAVVLIFREKTRTLTLLLPFFYVLAGTLKLNPEWFSGAALWTPSIPIPAILIRPSVLFVVFLELVVIWWLFSASAFLRWVTLGQILLFHLISVFWVGFFYPSVMIALMGFFALMWSEGRTTPFSWKKLSPESKTLMILIAVAQIGSLWPGHDSALFTRARLAALNMFDARTSCQASAWIKRGDERIHLPLREDRLGVRIHCDPVLFENMVRNLCRDERLSNPSTEVDFFLVAKRDTDAGFTPIESVTDACGKIARRSAIDTLIGRWPQ